MYDKFEQLCQERGVTPYVVAKTTNIQQSTFTHWKQGKYTPKVDKLMKIADFFEVPLEYLLKE